MIPDRPGQVALALLPGLAIVAVVADLAVNRSVILGLVIAAPLLAANVAGPRVTACYGCSRSSPVCCSGWWTTCTW